VDTPGRADDDPAEFSRSDFMDEQIERAAIALAWAYAEKLTADQSFVKALERLRRELAPAPRPKENQAE
jgi:hypothetical protein